MFEAPDLVLHSQDGHLQRVELNLRDGSERDGRGEKREERREDGGKRKRRVGRKRRREKREVEKEDRAALPVHWALKGLPSLCGPLCFSS